MLLLSHPSWHAVGILFPPASVGLIVLPVMLFHQLQLTACAIIAQRYAARPLTAPTPLIPAHAGIREEAG